MKVRTKGRGRFLPNAEPVDSIPHTKKSQAQQGPESPP